MSAIRIKDLNTAFFAFLLLMFFSCSKKASANKPIIKSNEEITFIGLSHIGGDSGSYRIIKITKDSIRLEKGFTVEKKHLEWNSAISKKTWQRLVSSFKIKDLDQIKSSLSIQPDGIDESFQIKTTKNSHIYVNAYNDTTNYRQLQNFKNKLEKIIPKEYK